MQREEAIKKTLNDMAKSLKGRLDTNKFLDYLLPLLFLKYLKSEELEALERDDNTIKGLKKLIDEIEEKDEYKDLFYFLDLDNKALGKDEDEREACISELLKELNKGFPFFASSLDNDHFAFAYEYLLGAFTADGGKNAGEFYTPQDLADLIIGLALLYKTPKSVYDPTCGSARLLLAALKSYHADAIKLYGQERNLRTYQLARMNMLLHGLDASRFSLYHGDTLEDDGFRGESFDLIVANPPYSISWNASKDKLSDPRFKGAGVLAPKSKGDWAFILHMLEHIKGDAIAISLVFPGILYRGNAEAKIRAYLVKELNAIDCVCALPSGLFYGTPISVCLLLLRKDRKPEDKVLFIDASADFVKNGKEYNMTQEHKNKVFEVVQSREERKYYSRLASISEIEANSFNLSPSYYVEHLNNNELIDIDALEKELAELEAKIQEQRDKMNEILRELKEF